MARQLTLCYNGTRRRHMRGGEGGTHTRKHGQIKAGSQGLAGGETRRLHCAQKRADQYLDLVRQHGADQQLERCRWRSPTSYEVRFRTVDTEGERSRAVKGPSSGARLCAVLGEKVRPGERHSYGDDIKLVPESPSASASWSQSVSHISSMSSGRLQRGSHVLPSDPYPSQLTRYLPSFRGPSRILDISYSPCNVSVLSRVNLGGEEGPVSDAEAELLTSRGEGRSFFVAVLFRFGWLRGDGIASESSVFESVSGTLAEVCAGFFFFAFAFGRGRGRGRV